MKLKKLISIEVALALFLTSLPLNSFANNINLKKDKHVKEISKIETKEDLQKSAQKAVESGEVDIWIEGFINMPTARSGLSSVVIDEKIYCIGGYNGASSHLNIVEVYDPRTDTWETRASMPTVRSGFSSVVVDGKIYCIGGYNSISSYLDKVEVYDPKTDTWETRASIPTVRSYFSSVAIDGKIYCIGGQDDSSYLNKIEVYDPRIDTWETRTNMPTARSYLSSVVVDGRIYCIGGYNNTSSYLNKVEVYNPKTNIWDTSKTSMPTARYGFSSVVVNGKIYCIGGTNSSDLNKLEIYDPEIDAWDISKTSMPTARNNLSSVFINGKIYCIGGRNKTLSYLNKVEAYIIQLSPEDNAKFAVSSAEQSKEPADIEHARNLVNQLSEGQIKDKLQKKLDTIIPNMSLTFVSSTANLDIYIKSENMLSMTLDTNSIIFEDFSGIEDIEKQNAINISISSSLPYQLNAYLPTEIQNTDKSNALDKAILNIKEASESTYQTFVNTTDKIVLKDNCTRGNDLIHNIDVKLKGGIAYEKDVYKTTIQLEAEQK